MKNIKWRPHPFEFPAGEAKVTAKALLDSLPIGYRRTNVAFNLQHTAHVAKLPPRLWGLRVGVVTVHASLSHHSVRDRDAQDGTPIAFGVSAEDSVRGLVANF